MRIDRHVFGSISGYQTLARSDGLSSSDLRILEGLSVGQTSDPALFGSLATSPAYIIRPLGGRRSITRVSVGPPDDQNRPTIRKVTLVVSRADWDGVLNGDIAPLVNHKGLWEWDGNPTIPAVDIVPTRDGPPRMESNAAQRVLALLSLIERSQQSGSSVVVREESCSLAEFRLLEMLIPPAARDRFAAVYRSLTKDISASLVCLADRAPVPASAETYRAGQAAELSAYARALSQAGLAKGTVPFEFIRSYRGFGMRSTPAVSPPTPPSRAPSSAFPPQVIVERTPRSVLVIASLACILLPLISGTCTYVLLKGTYEKRAAARDTQTEEANRRIAQLKENGAQSFDKLVAIDLPGFARDQRNKLQALGHDMADGFSVSGAEQKLATMKDKSAEMDQAEQALHEAAVPPGKSPAAWLREELTRLRTVKPGAYGTIADLVAKLPDSPPFPAVASQGQDSATSQPGIADSTHERELSKEFVTVVLGVLRSEFPSASSNGKVDPAEPVGLIEVLRKVVEAVNAAANKRGYTGEDVKDVLKRLEELRKATERSIQAAQQGGQPSAAIPSPPQGGQQAAWPKEQLIGSLVGLRDRIASAKNRKPADKQLLQELRDAISLLESGKAPQKRDPVAILTALRDELNNWMNPQNNGFETKPPTDGSVQGIVGAINDRLSGKDSVNIIKK